jgi:type II secretory pathway pseudopilin PulG
MKKQGTVWISTILYTVISLAIIGSLMAVVQPRISQLKDSIVIDQTKNSLTKLNEVMISTKEGAIGMHIPSEFKLGQGNLFVSGKNDSITWVFQTASRYSEVGRRIQAGDIYELTEKAGDGYNVSLSLFYDTNLTFNGKDDDKILQSAPLPYKIWFTNKGSYVDITLE